MKKTSITIMGLLALLSVPAFIGCTQDEEYGEEFSGQEFATLTGRSLTRSADADGDENQDDGKIKAGSATVSTDGMPEVELLISWTEGYPQTGSSSGDRPISEVSISVSNIKDPYVGSATFTLFDQRWMGSLIVFSGRVSGRFSLPTDTIDYPFSYNTEQISVGVY